MNEELIYIKLCNQDEEAISYLFDKYYNNLYHFAEKFIYNSDIAHDIVQDVLIRLWNNATKISQPNNFGNYLFISVKNECLSYLRGIKIRDEHNKKWASAYVESLNLDSVDSSFEDLVALVQEYLKTLPEQCCEIYKLRVLHGYKYSEIAKKIGVSENVVKVQLYRANKKIKEFLISKNYKAERFLILLELFSALVDF